MENYSGHLRTLIQGAAFVIFVLQMIYAVQKYYSQPIVTSMGSKSLEDVANPVIIAVCKMSQFDYVRAASIGYTRQTYFFSGILTKGKFYP